MKKRNLTNLLGVLSLSSVLFVGGVLAFLSDADTKTNSTTVGKISIDLQEPNWVENSAIELTPNKEIPKDPQILNNGVNPAYVFLEVQVPYVNIVTSDKETGEKFSSTETELWSYNINPGWTEIGSPTKDINTNIVTHTYVYGTLDNCTELSPGNTTPTLFDYVRFTNAVEDQGLEEEVKEIIINAYGIQTKNILDEKTNLDGNNTDGKVSAVEVWNVLKQQSPTINDKEDISVHLTTGSSFNSTIPSEATSIVFSSESFPLSETTMIDVSAENDGSVMAWLDGTTYHVSSGASNKVIYANEDSSDMFAQKDKISSIDFNNFNTSMIEDASMMFSYTGRNATSFKLNGLSDWDTSNITKMNHMFYFSGQHSGIWSIGDISNWNTSSVDTMACMFSYAATDTTSLTSFNLSGWDVSSVTNMNSLFSNFGGRVSSINLTGWDTSSVTGMNSMFSSCSRLRTIYVSDAWSTANVENSSYMFNDCTSLVGQSGTAYDSSRVDDTLANYQTGYLTYRKKTTPAVLMSGQSFNDTIPSGVSSISFTSEIVPNGIETFDVSEAQDRSILAWLEGDTYKVSTGNPTIEIYANKDCSDMFSWELTLTDISFDNFNTSKVENMSNMFCQTGCFGHKDCNLDLSSWDISNVTSMNDMFYKAFSNCNFNLNVSNWDTSKVTNMYEMFADCTTASITGLNTWNTSKVKNMSNMFYDLGYYRANAKELDLSSWDTISVTDMSSMFEYCRYIETIYVSDNWSIENVTNSDSMFSGCNDIVGQYNVTYEDSKTDKDMANWETGYLSYKKFNGISSLERGSSFNSVIPSTATAVVFTDEAFPDSSVRTLDVSDVGDGSILAWLDGNTFKVSSGRKGKKIKAHSNCKNMFYNKTNLQSVDFSDKLDTSGTTDMSYMFGYCSSLTNINGFENFNTSSVTNMEFMFVMDSKLAELRGVEDWDTSNVTTMRCMFEGGKQNTGAGKLSVFDISRWNTGKVKDMTCMFYGQGSMKSIDIADWDVSSCESFNHMFTDNYKLQYIDMGKWDTRSIKTTYNMFNDCYRLKTVGDISNWNVENAIDLGSMFCNCASLYQENGTLDLSGWNTKSCKSFGQMFYLCKKLKVIDIRGFDTSKATTSSWDGCGSGIYYAWGNEEYWCWCMRVMFRSCPSLQTIYVGDKWTTEGKDISNMFLDTTLKTVTPVE